MGFADRTYNRSWSSGGSSFGEALTPWVKRLLLANGAVWLLTVVRLIPFEWAVSVLGFSPVTVLRHPWSPLTYMFVHGGFWHLFFNMIILFFFGPPLERTWGSRAFIRYYLVCGGGAAAASFLFLLIPEMGTPQVIGASGALYGLLLAFALRWPEAPIYIWGLLPVKAKWFVAVLAFFSFMATISGGGGGVAHWAHLGGLVTGFLTLRLGDGAGGRKRRASAPRRERRTRPGAASRPGGHEETKTAAQRRRRQAVEPDVLDRVDEILDKIRERGIDSLTGEERAFLDEMSRRYRSTT